MNRTIRGAEESSACRGIAHAPLGVGKPPGKYGVSKRVHGRYHSNKQCGRKHAEDPVGLQFYLTSTRLLTPTSLLPLSKLAGKAVREPAIDNISHLRHDTGHAIDQGGIAIPVYLPRIKIKIGKNYSITVSFRDNRTR